MAIVSTVEVGIGDDRLRHEWSAINLVLRVLAPIEVVGENSFVPLHLAFDRLPVRIEQKLGRIAPQALGGIPWAMNAESITLTGPDVRKVAVPDESSHLREIDAGLICVLVE